MAASDVSALELHSFVPFSFINIVVCWNLAL
jgi:hypothetical protein